MTDRIQSCKARIDMLKGRLLEMQSAYESAESELESLQDRLYVVSGSKLLARKCLELSMKKKEKLERIIGSALTDVFGYRCTYTLEPVVDKNGGVKGLKQTLSEEGMDGSDEPLSAFGGGSHAIISICMKLAFVLLTKNLPKVLVMDEPLPNLATDLQPRFKEFLETVCTKTGLQVIMITHQSEPFGKVYKFEKVRGTTRVEELEWERPTV